MWTDPQIEAESLRKQRGTLSRQDRLDEGRGKQEWGTRWRGRGKPKRRGGATNAIPTLQFKGRPQGEEM
jgi:hypothetical protein